MALLLACLVAKLQEPASRGSNGYCFAGPEAPGHLKAVDGRCRDGGHAGIESQRKFWNGLKTRIDALNAASLDNEQRADLDIMKNQINLALLELTTIQSYKHNPTVYVELAGNALFSLSDSLRELVQFVHGTRMGAAS